MELQAGLGRGGPGSFPAKLLSLEAELRGWANLLKSQPPFLCPSQQPYGEKLSSWGRWQVPVRPDSAL